MVAQSVVGCMVDVTKSATHFSQVADELMSPTSEYLVLPLLFITEAVSKESMLLTPLKQALLGPILFLAVPAFMSKGKALQLKRSWLKRLNEARDKKILIEGQGPYTVDEAFITSDDGSTSVDSVALVGEKVVCCKKKMPEQSSGEERRFMQRERRQILKNMRFEVSMLEAAWHYLAAGALWWAADIVLSLK